MWRHRAPAPRASDVTQQFHETPGAVDFWGADLDKAEEITLDGLHCEIQNQPMLEIGVGGGRVTPHLLNISTTYVGIDYSSTMVDLCKCRFPGVDLRLCDARAMACFGNDRFYVVVLWGNLIDYVGIHDRPAILREVNRILKRNGILLLSTHNLDWNGIAWESAFACLQSWREVDLLRIRVYGRCLLNRFAAQIAARDYAVFPEYYLEGQSLPKRMVVPTCYIKKESQEKQLEEAGFTQISTMTVDGTQFSDSNRSRECTIFYTARKR